MPCTSFCTVAMKPVLVPVHRLAVEGATLTAMIVTVKLTPLLAPPLVVTTTFPVVAPLGTGATTLPLPQLVGVEGVPLNVTVGGCVNPKFAPVIVTGVLIDPDVGDRLVIVGGEVTVKVTTLLA